MNETKEQKEPTTLHDERGQTDTSLVSERGKTDDSFAEHRKQNELDTDMQIEADRQDADDTRSENRKSADATTVSGRSGRTKANQNRTKVEVSADSTLNTQRQRDDEAVNFERNLMDAALVRERERNDAEANKFFVREREETDKNLLRERKHTDSEALRSSNLLSSEVSLHQATKAALTSRDEFLAIVSHDLRNPIGAILSYSELLLEDAPRTAEEGKQWAEVIKRNAQTSLRLISDILDMERFAEGKLQLTLVPQDMNQLIQEAIETFSHAASERNISLKCIPSPTNRPVLCDRDRIFQVLGNLIGNAIKFTPENGQITIETNETENELQVSVKDNGIGIPKDKINRIFERYAQLENKSRQGLGLGLYISSMLVEAHHGKLGVESTPGRGTTFTFSIPFGNA
jgi:signal transduction histidine kinase